MKKFFSDRFVLKQTISEYRWTIFLLVSSVFLSFALLTEWGIMTWRDGMTRNRINEKTPQGDPPVVKSAPKFSDLPAMESYAQTVERPLFMEVRKPGEEPWRSAVHSAQTERQPVTLSGVILAPAGNEALLADEHQHTKRVKKGETWNGWTLLDVYPDHVLLEQGAEKLEIHMHMKKKPS
jgi:hypothetical protein